MSKIINNDKYIESLNILAKNELLTVDNLDLEEIFDYFVYNMNNINIFKENKELLVFIKDIKYEPNDDAKFANLLNRIVIVNSNNCNNIIKYLIKIGYDPFILNGHGTTICSNYIGYNRNVDIDIIKLLLKDDIVKNSSSNSLLHTACRYNRNLNIIKYLVERGCDVNLKNKKGMIPLDRLIYFNDKNNQDKFDRYSRNEGPIDEKVEYLRSVMDKKSLLLNDISRYDKLVSDKINRLIAKLRSNPIHDYYNNKKTIEEYDNFLNKLEEISNYVDSEVGSNNFLERNWFIETIIYNKEMAYDDYLEINIYEDLSEHYKKVDKLRNELKELLAKYEELKMELVEFELN